MSILYLPTITYIICISVRFYGLKRWINKIINEPIYFVFPILTSFSFYEKSKLNFRENIEIQDQLSVPQPVLSFNSQSMGAETTDEINVASEINITLVTEKLKKNEPLSVPHIVSPSNSQKNDATEKHGNMKTIVDVETTVETTDTHNRNITSMSVEMEKKNEQNNYPNNSQSLDFTEKDGNMKTIDDVSIETIEDTFENTVETKDKITPTHKINNAFMSVEAEKQFSIRQSNTLFFLFCASTSLCILGDLWHQWMRGKKIQLENIIICKVLFKNLIRDFLVTVHHR